MPGILNDFAAQVIDEEKARFEPAEQNEATDSPSPEPSTTSAPVIPAANLVDRPVKPAEPVMEARVLDPQLAKVLQKPDSRR